MTNIASRNTIQSSNSRSWLSGNSWATVLYNNMTKKELKRIAKGTFYLKNLENKKKEVTSFEINIPKKIDKEFYKEFVKNKLLKQYNNFKCLRTINLSN